MSNDRSIKPAHLLELLVHLPFWGGWILLINSGTRNGIGYFQQPDHNLLWPLINGAFFNAALFIGVAFWLIPQYLAKRRFSRFFGALLLFSLIYLLLKTLGERLIIVFSIPSLEDLSLFQLGLENSYTLAAFIVLGGLYRFSRDWLTGNRSGRKASADDRPAEQKSLLIKSGTKTHRIPIEDIRYVKSEGNYLVFDSTDQRLLTHMTMSQAMEKLPESKFVRLHRSYIVALAHIDAVENNRVTIKDTRLPIGGKYRQDFFDRLNGS